MFKCIWLFFPPCSFFKKFIQHTVIDCLEMPVTMCDCSGHTWLSNDIITNCCTLYDEKGVRWYKVGYKGEPILKLAD